MAAGTMPASLLVAIDSREPVEIGTFDLELKVLRERTTAAGTTITVDIRHALVDALRAAADEIEQEFIEPATNARMIGNALDLAGASPEYRAHLDQQHVFAELTDAPTWRDGTEHLIYGGRQEGKTTLALRWVLDAPEGVKRVLVVLNEQEVSIHRTAAGLERRDDRIISYRSLMNRHPVAVPYREAGIPVEYGIDETAQILSDLMGLHSLPSLMTVCTAAPWQGTQQ